MPNGISKNEEMMKKDWIIKKLGEVCEIKDSQRKPITANKRKPGPIPYYGATGILDYVEDYLFDEDLILLGEDGAKWGSGDRSAFKISGKTWVNNHAHVLKPANYIDYTWLIYYLNYSDLTPFVKGATVPKLNQENTRNIPIPIPPLEEQKRIVAVLDKKFAQIETLKTAAEKNLQNTKQLFQAELEKAFSNTSWEKKRLDEVCAITSKLVDPTQPEYLDLYHVGGANIESETGIIIDLKTSKEEGLSSGKFTFDESMVLYNKIRPYLKKVARPDFSGLCSADMYPLNPKGNITKDYLYYILISDNFTEYAISKSGRAGMPKVNREALFAYECYLPPLEEQKRIVAHLDSLSEKVHQLEEIYTKQLADCADLKQSLLQKAFEGEL